MLESTKNASRLYLLEKSQSCSEESSFIYSPASSTSSSSSSLSTCSSPPPASPDSTLSDPPSPTPSWSSDCDDRIYPSAVSKKRSSNHFEDARQCQPFVNKKPKFATKYDEMLQPLSPMTYLPVESLMLPPTTHRPNFNQASQKQFRSLLESNVKSSEIESFLCENSEKIDINEYNSEGRTALHQSCFDGNLPMAKVLVRFGANAKLTTRDGFSLLHIAAFTGHSNIMFYILSLRS